MYTILFTINCVEQLIFSKTFVDHLQFEQLIFFCLKVKLLESSWSAKIIWIRAVDKKNNYCSNGVEQMKNCVEQIFWANNFRADDHDPKKSPAAWTLRRRPLSGRWPRCRPRPSSRRTRTWWRGAAASGTKHKPRTQTIIERFSLNVFHWTQTIIERF